jgi:hypothetical protein
MSGTVPATVSQRMARHVLKDHKTGDYCLTVIRENVQFSRCSVCQGLLLEWEWMSK